MMFNGDLDGYAWGGGACAVLDGTRRCPRTTWNPPWAFTNLAPLAHEMGHGYGLPHSDNSDGDDDTYDNPWDVMSDAWSNAMYNVNFGALPKHINMAQRDRLGWVAAARQLVIPAGHLARARPGSRRGWSPTGRGGRAVCATGRACRSRTTPTATTEPTTSPGT